MQLNQYINELLYRYDCVIVPNFGGFVSNMSNTVINRDTHEFTPPKKSISFNVNLQHNDGLLANYVASTLQVDFETATQKISETVQNWNHHLTTAHLILEHLGTFVKHKDLLVFEPALKNNYLTSSFGLSNITTEIIFRAVENQKTTKPLYKTTVAIAAVITGLMIAANVYIDNLSYQHEVAAQKQMMQKIQHASFVINDPMPAIKLAITVPLEVLTDQEETLENTNTLANTGNFHVIAGAFGSLKNAEKFANQLKEKGYLNAHVVGENTYGLAQVAYASFSDKNSAQQYINQIHQTDANAWVLVK